MAESRLSCLSVSFLVHWWCPHHFFLPILFLMFPRRQQIQKGNISYPQTVLSILWTTIFFLSCFLLFLFHFRWFSFLPPKEVGWKERAQLRVRLVTGTHTIAITVSAVLPYEAARYFVSMSSTCDQLEYSPPQRSKRRWTATDWCSKNHFVNGDQEGWGKQLFLSSFRYPPYSIMKWT